MDVVSIVCSPGQSVCHGTCVNEQTDNNNCGGCGIVCSAASPSSAGCTLGRCLVTLASGSGYGGFTVGPIGVYALTSSADSSGVIVVSVPIGGGPPTTLASGQISSGIATDGTSVYWTTYEEDGRVMKVPVGGGTLWTLAWNQIFARSITVHATDVYWTTWTGFGLEGRVMKLPVGGGSPLTLAASQKGPDGVSANATGVYWATHGAVMRVPLGGGSPTTVISAGVSEHFALDATNVYYCRYAGDNESSAVMKVPVGGGTSTALASGSCVEIAVDGTDVYWTEAGGSDGPDGRVMKVPIGGGTPTVLAARQYGPRLIAVDATSVYWTKNTGNGEALMKLTPK